MDFFVKAKHWQLFLLLCGVPIVLQIFMLVSISIAVTSGRPLLAIGNVFVLMPIATILFAITLFSWLYNLGTRFYGKLPKGIVISLNMFKVCIILPAAYIAILSMIMFGLFKSMGALVTSGNADPTAISTQESILLSSMTFIFIMHLVSMAAIIYSLRFVAKTLRSIEIGQEALINDYLGEFFLFWFFPIGIWVLQPRINKLFENISNHSDIVDTNQTHS